MFNGNTLWKTKYRSGKKVLINFLFIFCLDRRNSEESLATIELLETVDDELTAHGVNMVKTSDLVVAEEYGVDEVIPEIVYFENGIPSLYPGKKYYSTCYVLEPYWVWKEMNFCKIKISCQFD